MSEKKVRFGVVGVNGFSQKHISWLLRAAEEGAPVELSAVAAIFSDAESTAAGKRQEKNGVRVVRSYDDLLALHNAVDIITLPVGIHLHVPLAVKALSAGFAVYLEKPVAGTVDEAAALARAERNSGRRLFIGFQTLYQPSTWTLKRQLLSGLVGKVRRIVASIAWPRSMSYYRRNRWAGKISVDGTFVYDCPMNNAAAHFLNASLFFAGAGEGESATPIGVEAELYRACPIEAADSVFCRFATREGVDIVFNGTQACDGDEVATLEIIGDKGRVDIVDGKERMFAPWAVVDAAGGSRSDGGDIAPAQLFGQVAKAFRNPEIKEISALSTAKMHTVANQMAFSAADIHSIDAAFVERAPRGEGDELYAVKGVRKAMETLRENGLLPSESGMCAWSVKPGIAGKAVVERLLATVGIKA